ncbi:MAG: hypothetical protein V1794_18055, partial [Candidatus Glassbacteria bacterium]
IGPRTLGFLDIMDLFSGQYSMTLGAMLIALFVGWRWGTRKLVEEITHGDDPGFVRRLIAFQIRWICPLVLVGLIVYMILNPNAFA